MNSELLLQKAQNAIQIEAQALSALSQSIDDTFVEVVKLINNTGGKLVISGIGKSALVGQKIVATLNSTGTCAVFMHASEAFHGDLGVIEKEDVVLVISKSGHSQEIVSLAHYLKGFGNTIISMVSNTESTLAKLSNFVLHTPVAAEADLLNLAPTTSTTLQMAMGDALAVCLMDLNDFSAGDFARFHPGGSLGVQLNMKVEQVLDRVNIPKVLEDDILENVIVEISSKRKGAVAVVNGEDQVLGIITDGDLRRMLQEEGYNPNACAADIMSLEPKLVKSDELAIDALYYMEKHDISQLVVVAPNFPVYLGIIHLHELLDRGLKK